MTPLAHLRARLVDVEAGPAVIAVAVFLAVSVAAWLLLGQTGLDVVLVAAVALVIWNGGLLHSRVDESLDVSDENKGQIESVKTVLFGNETGTGKHSKGRAA